MNDAECLALVIGQRELAGSSPMRSAAFQLHFVLLAGRVLRNGVERIISISFARVVGAGWIKRTCVGVVLRAASVLVQGAADGVWLAHLHVARHAESQNAADQNESLHDDVDLWEAGVENANQGNHRFMELEESSEEEVNRSQRYIPTQLGWRQ